MQTGWPEIMPVPVMTPSPGSLLVHVEVAAPVLHEQVVLVEGIGVEQGVDPVAGGQLAHGDLLLDRLVAAAGLGGLLAHAEVLGLSEQRHTHSLPEAPHDCDGGLYHGAGLGMLRGPRARKAGRRRSVTPTPSMHPRVIPSTATALGAAVLTAMTRLVSMSSRRATEEREPVPSECEGRGSAPPGEIPHPPAPPSSRPGSG